MGLKHGSNPSSEDKKNVIEKNMHMEAPNVLMLAKVSIAALCDFPPIIRSMCIF